MSEPIKELCLTCGKTQECKFVKHASGMETLCSVCGRQLDFDIYEMDDDDPNEPVGSCEECGTNLYAEDDFNLCDQCLWRSGGGV